MSRVVGIVAAVGNHATKLICIDRYVDGDERLVVIADAMFKGVLYEHDK